MKKFLVTCGTADETRMNETSSTVYTEDELLQVDSYTDLPNRLYQTKIFKEEYQLVEWITAITRIQ